MSICLVLLCCDECHICIGFSGYLGFIFWGLICIYLQFMHIFPNYARFWFVERLLQISIIQAKIRGEMFEMNLSYWSVGQEDQKKLAKRPKIPQEKEKPAAQGKALNRPKRSVPRQPPPPRAAATTAWPWWTPRPVVAAMAWPWWPVLPPGAVSPSRDDSVFGGFRYFLALYCDVSGH